MNEPKPQLKPLAARLDVLLDATGLSGKDFAQRLGWPESKVSRIRRGIVRPSVEDVQMWTREVGADTQADDLLAILAGIPARKNRFQGDLAEVQRDHDKLMAESTHIRYFDNAWIPGLVQTRDYARRAIGEIWEINGREGNLEEAVAARMRRQAHLYDETKTYQILIAEPVLTQGAIAEEIMVPQLHVLLTWLSASNVQLGILPHRGKNRRTPIIGFQMYDDLAIVEDQFDEWERPPDRVGRLFDDMWSSASIGEAARPLIEEAIAEWGATNG